MGVWHARMLVDMMNREQLSKRYKLTPQSTSILNRRRECERDRGVSVVIWLRCRQQIIRKVHSIFVIPRHMYGAHIHSGINSDASEMNVSSFWIASFYAMHLSVNFVINVNRNYWNHPNAVIYLPFDTAKVTLCQLNGAIPCQTPPVRLQTDAKAYFARSVIACCDVSWWKLM